MTANPTDTKPTTTVSSALARAWTAVRGEVIAAREKHKYSTIDTLATRDHKLRILAEEHGEVARAIDDIEKTRNHADNVAAIRHLVTELAQVAGSAMAWAEGELRALDGAERIPPRLVADPVAKPDDAPHPSVDYSTHLLARLCRRIIDNGASRSTAAQRSIHEARDAFMAQLFQTIGPRQMVSLARDMMGVVANRAPEIVQVISEPEGKRSIGTLGLKITDSTPAGVSQEIAALDAARRVCSAASAGQDMTISTVELVAMARQLTGIGTPIVQHTMAPAAPPPAVLVTAKKVIDVAGAPYRLPAARELVALAQHVVDQAPPKVIKVDAKGPVYGTAALAEHARKLLAIDYPRNGFDLRGRMERIAADVGPEAESRRRIGEHLSRPLYYGEGGGRVTGFPTIKLADLGFQPGKIYDSADVDHALHSHIAEQLHDRTLAMFGPEVLADMRERAAGGINVDVLPELHFEHDLLDRRCRFTIGDDKATTYAGTVEAVDTREHLGSSVVVYVRPDSASLPVVARRFESIILEAKATAS